MSLSLLDLLAIAAVIIIVRPILAFVKFVARMGANMASEKVLERIHGKDMAAIMIAQSVEEPMNQLIRTFVAPGTVKLDTERRPIKRSNVGR